jgi:EAL domain-containing protein (putative c-di-GMP-specific phosphodiesterase class I)/CheY-like chemotaxis protein
MKQGPVAQLSEYRTSSAVTNQPGSPPVPASRRRLAYALDDEEGILSFVGETLSEVGFEVRLFTSPRPFLAAIENEHPDLVILDLALKDGDGVSVLSDLQKLQYRGGVLLMSGYDPRILQTARRVGERHHLDMRGCIRKPFGPSQLRQFLLDLGVTAQSDLAADFDNAIEERQFFLEFQPKLYLSTGKTVGAEALVRWRHPNWGRVMPGHFIPLLDKSKLHRLTEHVLGLALQHAVLLHAAGHETDISINVPGSALTEIDLVEVVRKLRQQLKTKIPLTLEVTETEAFADELVAAEVLTKLRLNDISLAIDDFGVGYSSLVRLRDMPFSEIKIDRTFVRDFLTNEASRAVIESVLHLAKGLGLASVAEGVEDKETLDALRDRGCDFAQGYVISRPLSADDFLAYLYRDR